LFLRKINPTMRHLVHLSFALLILSGGVCAAQERIPKFSNYPARVVRVRRPAKVQLRSAPDTYCFRTMLRRTAREGQRFAGHYAWTRWGCGTSCARIGIVDLVSGRAYVSPFFVPGVGITTRPDSRLMLVNDPEVIGKEYGDPLPKEYEPVYFLWTGRQLRPVLADGTIGREWERQFDPCSR
jgi:hypothetical protein